MKKWLLAVLCCAGCASPFIYAPAPQQAADLSKAVQFSGFVARYELGFSGVSVFEDNAVRLVVISEVGVKLLDMRAGEDKTFIYYRAAKLPGRAVSAFNTLARTYFLTECPPAQIDYYDKSLRADIEVRTQGGVCR